MRLLRLIVAVVALAALLSGCVRTTAGTARPGAELTGSPTGTSDPGGRLDEFLLTADEVDVVMGSRDIGLIDSAQDMADHSSGISDPGCLGALYNAEADVYQGSGWTDVADQVLTEPQDDSDHWVEQTVVQFPSHQHALDFFNKSVRDWTNCIGKDVMVDDGENQFDWHFEGIGISDNMMTQTSRQSNGGDWACQHALGAEGDYIVETSACGNSPEGEAVMVANQIVANLK
jgi:hypothetical protein